ncbi:MAG: ATP-binding cassette domain-containing protein [Helicobacteraceae bacterium]|jgi:cell division transport system ATP-binding protein|nr:ATP-binding cassette domain-containing protein [Helicobacteraceae bacterium]
MRNELIGAKELALAYDDKEVVLRDLTFSVFEGDLIFITGASGSGKSTLLKAFYGAIAPKEGFLQVGGMRMPPLVRPLIDRLRRRLGIVFQDYRLINEWTVERNIALPLLIAGYDQKTIRTQVDNLLKHIELTHRRNSFPPQLSGGEQQRVAVARALSHNPLLILADEPTGNLDDRSAQIVYQKMLMGINNLGKTVIIVTHHLPQNIGMKYRHFRIDTGIKTINENT